MGAPPPELDALGELDPQAAISVAAAIVAAMSGSLEVSVYMEQVVSGRRLHQCNAPALMRAGRTWSRRVTAL